MQTLEQFARACHDALKAHPGVQGRERVRHLLEQVLQDDAFVAANVTDSTPERQLLYEDSELGFCILAHNYQGAKESSPHDHGPSWAIYGQANGITNMSDWELIAPPVADQPGKVRRTRVYDLSPGMAHVYNEGDLHAPSRTGPTQLIRIEGTRMDRVTRGKFEAV